MDRHRFVIAGTSETRADAGSPLARQESGTASSELLFAIKVTPIARGDGVDLQTPSLDDTDLVEIALDGGGHLWMSVAELRESDLIDNTTKRSGNEAQRIHRTVPASVRTRGLGDWAIRALRFFRIDPAAELANAAERRMVDYIEGMLDIAPGLYRLDDTAAEPAFIALGARPRFDDQPYLLFLHGTNSSTQGSFGDMWRHEGGRAIRALRERYGQGHLLALQHRSLSESPVANALTVARLIPDNVRIDIVSHSRGGMIGELLARACVAADQPAFTAAEIAHYRSGSTAAGVRELEELDTLLSRRRYRIERFVRVACPARGTTLASDKISRYCNIMLNLVDARLLAAVDGMTATLFALLKATIKDLVDFSDLPGLAAMNPASPLVKLLNGEQRVVSADLTIIAGDTEGGSWVGRLGMLLVDAFFDRDNDLVVDTLSMHGGAARTAPAHQYLQRAADINHLCYFRHAVTLERIVRALCETDPLRRRAGFEQVDIAQDALGREPVTLRPVTRSTSALPPIVFVVPGIMGTHLKVNHKRVWLSYPKLVFGGFGKLTVSARQVEPDGLDADTYADLVDFLARTHEVVPFGYDWRLPVQAAAKRLNEALHAVLARIDSRHQPIRIVAHSMGGLVARAMMLLDDSAWPLICRHEHARLLMLGTPNAGSHSITQLLFGEEKLVRMLATFDLRNRLDTIVGQIAAFPGALDMLPESDERAYFDAATWTALAKETRPADWPTPTVAELARARAWRDRLAAQALDPQRVFYVAGQAEETPIEVDVETVGARKRIRFRSTAAGDGRVPWSGGIPAELDPWYANARHGDLAAHAAAHTGYLDILERGDTAVPSLRRERPAVRSELRSTGTADETSSWLAQPTSVASLPTLDEIARAASGRDIVARGLKLQQAPLPIRVAWGDLRHARHAVMVGHYVGDSLISAEAAIDRALDGRLGESHRLGVYPGERGTSLAIIDVSASPPGVVVIGLGDIGKLTPGALGDAVARGVVAWIGGREDQRRRSRDSAPGGGISLLMIGSGEGGVDADTAVFSILRGVSEGIDRGRRAGIAATLAEIEFVELYRDRAHRLWHTLDRLLGHGELHEQFVLSGTIIESGDGRTRLWEAAPSGWWRRLQITATQKHDGEAGIDELVFTSLTDSARSEAYRLPFQHAVVQRLVEQSIAGTERDESREKTLFELMLPNELKERAPQRESLVLLLDRSTANLPWELLTDPLERASADVADGLPLAIRAGLVRQFATSTFRPRSSIVVENTALVIGDPKPPSANFPELAGAQREARLVAGLLGSNARFRVEHLHQPSAEAVVQALLPKRYRILHVAGHGMLADSDSDRDSGIVLDAFNLSWASLDQMRAIPELVFINCCHLGRVATGVRDASLSRRNAFAAGVGEVFIRNGARAVIAAGWAVEDNGAERFARIFYTLMLAGERFGDAVHQARREVHVKESRSNTWGAYQCYGDPDYRLVTGRAAGAGSWPVPRYASTEEMITDAIDTIAGGDLDADARERVRQQIAAFAASASELEPLQRARVQLALARASARSLLHIDAIDLYQSVLELDGDALSLGDLAIQAEQYVGAALEQARGIDGNAAVEHSLQHAIARLERLLSIQPHAARRLLLARTLQHAALLRSGAARRKSLEKALLHVEATAPDSATTSFLTLLIAWRVGTPPLRMRTRLRKRVEAIAALAAERADDPREAFEVALIEVLLDGKLAPAQRARLLSAGHSARAIGAALSTAPVDSLTFAIAMLDQAESAAGVRLRTALQSVDAGLQRHN